MSVITSSFRSFGVSSITATLILLLFLTATPNVNAQKTPPILKDNDSSAFNKSKITTLQNTAAANTDEGKLARNKLIAITVEQVDIAFNDFRKNSRKRADLLSFLFDVLEIGASSAISIVNGTRSKTLIGEGLSLFQGSRSAFNKNFRFLERQILFDKMVAKRSEKLTAIYGKLNKNTVEYPWEQARSELRDYFFAGTIDEALSSLSRETGAHAQTAERDLVAAKRAAGIVGAPTVQQVEASKANFNLIRQITAAGANATTPEAKQAVLDDYRELFDVIQADNKLQPLLDQIPRVFSDGDPQERQNLEDRLGRVTQNKSPTLADYDSIALKLSELAAESANTDPTIAASLKNILSTSKTLN